MFNASESRPLAQAERPQRTNAEQDSQNPETSPLPVQPNNTNARGRPRGRPLVAETNAPLPLVEAQHLLGSHRCGPEKAPERDFLLEPNLELTIEP